MFPDSTKTYPSPLLPKKEGDEKKHKPRFELPERSFVENGTFIIQEKYFRNIIELQSCYKFPRGGAMKEVVY